MPDRVYGYYRASPGMYQQSWINLDETGRPVSIGFGKLKLDLATESWWMEKERAEKKFRSM